MSNSGETPKKRQNKVAPAPPPAPSEKNELSLNSDGAGFNPRSGRALWELGVLVAVLLAAGASLVFLGGALASALTPLIPVSFDRSLGEASQEQFAAGSDDCENPEAKAYIEDLARPLLKAAEPLPFEFSFRVADVDEVNAFALPGGFVTVNRGLLEAAQTGEEVAGVIGHEIQHALLRHGTKRILRQVGGSVLLGLVFGGTDFHAYGQVATQLSHLSYDRGQESEADHKGVELLIKSGVDPSGLASFFERLGAEGLRPPVLLSTHPDPGDRARLVEDAASGQSFQKLPTPKGVRCK
jgi:predicted Zn-dependent protease